MISSVKHISVMSPYALANMNPPPGKPLISLSQNESLRPPSPLVAEAVASVLGTGHLYPDPDWLNLRSALSKLHSIPEEGILCGNGSMELIASLGQAFADERNAVLAPAHAYPFFRTVTQMARARFDVASEKDGCVSVDALIAAVKSDTRIVFVANPGNPTGTRIPRSELVRLRESLPSKTLLVIDEAYGEFADHLKEPMFELVARGDTIVLRTFSKAYSLAGMRVGWGLFPTNIAQELRKVMNPNNISAVGQAAATAALADQAYMIETCKQTTSLRDGLRKRLVNAGLNVPNSFTNFLLLPMGSPDKTHRINEALRARGVFLRPQGVVGLNDCLRATIGVADHLDIAAELLENWAKEGLL